MVEEYEEIADPSERPDDPDDDLGEESRNGCSVSAETQCHIFMTVLTCF